MIYDPGDAASMARTVLPRPVEKVQFNIRVDHEVLARFRDYCGRNGLDPQGQIVLFMRKVLDTEFDFQERLWSALKEERS
jgi:antitoxin component of RelBE/YafQ-DinJ toxin-antitoxin module